MSFVNETKDLGFCCSLPGALAEGSIATFFLPFAGGRRNERQINQRD